MSLHWLTKLRLAARDRKHRRRLGLERLPLNRFRVRLARSVADYEGAFRLVQAAYVARGIEQVLSPTVRIQPQHVLPEAYVLIAEEHDLLVGTLTVTLDSSAQLPLDKDYGPELAALRAQGLLLCEFGSQAVVERCRNSGVAALLSMAAFSIATKKLDADRVVIGVNPRAVDHFRAAFNFQLLGSSKDHAQLVAPVIGLQTNLRVFGRFMTEHFPKPMQTGQSVAEHCVGAPMPCFSLPEGSHAELTRWKMPREVFQDLFLRRSDRVATLDQKTRQHLEELRSPTTIGSYHLKRRPA